MIVSDSTGKFIDSTRSDDRGGYAFKGLKPGTYIVAAKAQGFISSTNENIKVTTPPEGTDEDDDTYYAIRLDIILSPVKTQK